MKSSVPIGPVGVWSMELRSRNPEVDQVAAELNDQGWGAMWIAGAGGPGIWASAERLLAAGSRTSVALGVVSIWSEDARRTSSEHVRLREQYGSRLLTGFGVSNPQAAAASGHTFASPLSEMQRFLDELDADAGGPPRQERLLGALGPQMVSLAGDRTAGIHPFLVTPGLTSNYRSLLGPEPLIAPHQAVVLETDPARARATARAGIGMYFGFPSYQANLRRAGFGDDDFLRGGSDRLIDATVAWGDMDAIVRRVQEQHAAGADHVAIQVLTDTRGFPRHEWAELSHALLPSET